MEIFTTLRIPEETHMCGTLESKYNSVLKIEQEREGRELGCFLQEIWNSNWVIHLLENYRFFKNTCCKIEVTENSKPINPQRDWSLKYFYS